MAPAGQAALPPFVQLAAHPLRWRLLTELAGGDQRVRELVASVGQPQNLVSYHLRLLREGGLVAARRSSADARDSYYHLDLDRCGRGLCAAGSALHPALHPDAGCTRPAAEKQRPSGISVLFACTGNSARSPIAEALLRHRAEDVDVVSAGSHPKRQLHPEAVRVLREKYGIDVGLQRPRHLETLAGRHFDYVVTLCDKVREVCPEFGEHSHRMHWSIPDPAVAGDAGQADYGAFLRTATDIENRIRHLLSALATEEALP